ncbi:hypothetical protein DVT68_14850 [Dyella solisilvae]|uniref:Uncharacterized protein n=1 Tax=Dyella solisilvae TaxID=1920168 RepID=A0A370K4J1_9GAMM|nr:hypothetical protein [Dyella solisilvae]RDI97572.1 hypothetical protein DVT68_14850 [Dyella solisilvae]
MASNRHISIVNSERFEFAISQALKVMLAARAPFKVIDVIKAARYEDGSTVGETTLYAKNSDGAFVHGKLLSKIKAASLSSRSKRIPRGARRKTPVSGAARELSGDGPLQRQLVEQEVELLGLRAALDQLGLVVLRRQMDLYTILTAMNLLTRGSVLDIQRWLRELEAELPSTVDIGELRSTAAALDVQCRGVIRKV